MLNIFLGLLFVTIILIISKKVVDKQGEKATKVNPYLQTVIFILLLFVFINTMLYFFGNAQWVITSIWIVTLAVTAYVGMIFQKYYMQLSELKDAQLKAYSNNLDEKYGKKKKKKQK